MNIALALFVGATVFFLGFCLGANPPFQAKKGKAEKLRDIQLLAEYKNFLSYDGSVQN